MARHDYYAVLGVQRSATAEDIKRSFRQLALQYHPDRNPDDVSAERRFREAVEAYDCLSDPDERNRYDRLGALYRPTWMDVPPMLYSGNPTPAEPGMVLFLHAILIDAPKNLAMSLGHTIVLTKTGRDVLSGLTPEYSICT